MPALSRFRPVSGAVLCALIVASSPTTPLFAQAKAGVEDGEVSRDGCAKLGFDPTRDAYGGYTGARALPTPPPPPPPVSSPEVGNVSELTITGTRIPQPNMVSSAPITVI